MRGRQDALPDPPPDAAPDRALQKSLEHGSAYAGLWPRLKAFGLDYLFIAGYLVLLVLLALLLRNLAPGVLSRAFGTRIGAQAVGFALITLPVGAYFALTEAGAGATLGATVGKRRLGLRVAGPRGVGLSPARSVLRTVLKFLPWELSHTLIWQLRFTPAMPGAVSTVGFTLVWALVLGNVLSVVLDPRRRALYDLAAGSVVVRGAGH